MYTLKKLLEWLKALPVDFTDKFFHIFKRWKRSNRFPAGTTHRVKEHMSDPVIIKKAPKAPKKPPYKPVLHLIGITELLSTELREIFEIITSTNALEGFSKTKHQLPDLVICEVNLPGYSGIELCRRLKETSKTQYIPIILLVPKTSDEEIITALRNGADDIVEKPVCSSILKVKAKNLVDYNKQLKLHVQKESTEMISPFPISDPVFLQKATDAVIRHLEDSNFEANDFAREIGISRAQLYRKLQLCTGKSAKEFIRTIRLEKAASLLLEHNFNISEIAFRTGFNSPSYFTKSFTEHFGLPPRHFVKQKSNNFS